MIDIFDRLREEFKAVESMVLVAETHENLDSLHKDTLKEYFEAMLVHLDNMDDCISELWKLEADDCR